MKIDFDGLQAFVTVAELGAFNKAADKLNITQAALTRRIQKLENYLGLRLIERTTRHVALSSVGKDLLPRVRILVQDMASTFNQLKDVSRSAKGHFTLACVPTMATSVLPALIRQYRDKYPGNRIKLVDASAYEIREAIFSQHAEIGLTVQGTRHPDLEEVPLFDDPLMFYCRQSHALSEKPFVTWSDMNLKDLIVVSSFTGTRIVMNYQLAKKGIELQGNYEVQHHATALNLVAADVGCAIMPATICGDGDRPGVIRIPLKSPVVRRKIVLIKRKGSSLSPAAQAFVDIVQSMKLVWHQ
ncbi:LysR family transcriptional regulator [Limnohabitans sp. 2KL-1]|jgi:DNA-binding transcriptional LysR family regulator|uniref:LysR family transcriptional regulator n=1 Tax=Limnohabitans sp. 2KL-1 TaxID=1100699 RepID=UPI000D3AD658|nr:LysR family transcriptional regulator [Limnohabitans sp. 2KL-1]PUE46481.1 LysR family transcriptional regulator [Limnohabitans sp. 2KL-1]